MVIVLAVLAVVVLTLTGSSAQNGLEVSHRARRVEPGEVVLILVACREPLQDVSGVWLDRTLTFYPVEGGRWQGLAPIDLATRSGRSSLAVHARTQAGRMLERLYWLTVQPRNFPVRRLTVAAEFADPPAELLPRLDEERKSVETIVSRVTPERLWQGAFVPPVPGTATSSFGRRSIVNGQARSPHSGTDFQAASGTAVVAPNRGRVALVADQYFSGRIVIIDHGLGVYSYLAHLSEALVSAGDVVERGQKIALSGSTGRVTGPHLHWTVRIARARVDPLSLVSLLEGK